MKIKTVQIPICEPCLNGEGDECHTPGCALFLHSVDLPISPEFYTVISEEIVDDDVSANNVLASTGLMKPPTP